MSGVRREESMLRSSQAGDWLFEEDQPTQDIVPAEKRGHIMCGGASGIAPVFSEEQLKELLESQAKAGAGIRVVSSGWSWNPIIEAREDCLNVFLAGDLSTRCEIDAASRSARVSGGLMICDFISQLLNKAPDLEWAPKGNCFLPNSSQCFAGFIATNVHHSWTPTAYDHVRSFRIANFDDQRCAQIVTASRETNLDLFESVFGGVGITGIIVEVELLLRPATYYNLQCEGPAHYEPSELKSLLMRVVEVKGSWSFVLPTEHQYQTKIVTQLEGVHAEQAADLYRVKPAAGKKWSKPMPRTRPVTACSLRGGFWRWLESRVARKLFQKQNESSVWEGQGLNPYKAFSMSASRANLDGSDDAVRKGHVMWSASSAGYLDDMSMFVPVEQYELFVDIWLSHVTNMPPALIGMRFLPRPETASPTGGGLLACNAQRDCVAFEFLSLGKIQSMTSKRFLCCGCGQTRMVDWMEDFCDDLFASGLRLQLHLGKTGDLCKIIQHTYAVTRNMEDKYDSCL